MKARGLVGIASLAIVSLAAWIGKPGLGDVQPRKSEWTKIAPGILRTERMPFGYALIDGKSAMLIDCPLPPKSLESQGIEKFDRVLLTHFHRDTAAAIGSYLECHVPVRAPKESAGWLTPAGLAKYWANSIPLPNSQNAVFQVFPEGFDGIDCTILPGESLAFGGWTIEVVATPGHTRDHVAYAARRDKNAAPTVFCGDVLASPGKLWAPYNTDWDHWTDLGLKPTEASLRKLAEMKPALLLPAHGEPIEKDCAAVLTQTADAVAEVAFLRSFERYSKERLGDAPEYRFLAPDQRQSIGERPWTQVSKHLFLTGNTYVLVSDKDNAYLVFDPYGKTIADQMRTLVKDQKLGEMELILFSHAHNDHYIGIHDLPRKDRAKVWTLDVVASAIADPFVVRAPFLDPRPLVFDRTFKDGETAQWHEYKFKFHHYPGQTHYTMAVETTIDGKRCLFTADNFYHHDMFSGSGGWMGVNWSWPLPYAHSAKKTLEIAPEWVLAEHGGPFEFSAEDWRRRVKWGEVGAKAADAVSPSGHCTVDWHPNRIRFRPWVLKARAGETRGVVLIADNPLPRAQRLTLALRGRGVLEDRDWTLETPANGSAQIEVKLVLSERAAQGRHVFPIDVRSGDVQDPADVVLVVDVMK